MEGGGEGMAVRAHLTASLARLATGVMLGMLAVNMADVLGAVMGRAAMTAMLLGALILHAEAFTFRRAVQSLAATLAGRPLRGGVMLRAEAFVMLAVNAVMRVAAGMHDAAACLAGVALVLHMAAVLALLGFLVDLLGPGAGFRLVPEVHFGLIDAARRLVMATAMLVAAMMFMMLHGSTLFKPA